MRSASSRSESTNAEGSLVLCMRLDQHVSRQSVGTLHEQFIYV